MDDATIARDRNALRPCVHPGETVLSVADRIVVVDDHAELADTLAEILALDGFDVRTAADGERALAVIAEHTPLCVITDVDMPKLNGFELAGRLRQRYGADLVLIAITGWGEDDDRVSAVFDVFNHCLRKPVDLQTLRKILRPT
jgi:DNA-binding response OmpR family regulator